MFMVVADMDSFGPQLENLVAAVRNEAPLLRDAAYAVNDIRESSSMHPLAHPSIHPFIYR